MDIKIKFEDLQLLLKMNVEMKNLLHDAEITLARMQRRLPESSKYDSDAQACATMRGKITNFFNIELNIEIPVGA